MARPRTIPDAAILSIVRSLLAEGGDKAASFSAVAARSGLAPASLAQRYGSVAGLVQAAAVEGLDQALAALARAEADQPDKGPQALLKALAEAAPGPAVLAVLARSAEGRTRAEGFRRQVEAALARRLGPRSADQAPILFAAWAGMQAWSAAGDPGFRLKDVVRRLT